MHAKRSLRWVSLIFPIALAVLLFASPTGAGTNNSYTWTTTPSVNPNLVATGGSIPLTFYGGTPAVLNPDDGFAQVTIPFPFTFYGQTFTSAWVSTNGYINFLGEPPKDGDGDQADYSNACGVFAASDNIKGSIYAFWDDLDTSSGSVRTQTLGTAPNRHFVIEWNNVGFFGDSVRRLSFEIVLSENGTITLQYYQDIDNDFLERGGYATIGLESPDGQSAIQFSCDDSTKLGIGGFAIQFSPPSTGPVTQTVDVDVKPGSCRNRIKVGHKGKGVLRVAILGTANFHVTTVDPGTVKLEGVPALRWSHGDVATTPNQCYRRRPDGNLDMTFQFDREEVIRALGSVDDGQQVQLHLTGTLRSTGPTATLQNGAPISGEDKVTIINKAKKRNWHSESRRHNDRDNDRDEDDDDDDD